MSADNGIYILVTPTEKGGVCEYRVAEAQAIENLVYFDPSGDEIAMWDYFHHSTVYYSEEMAWKSARELETIIENSEFGYLEYGLKKIQMSKVFPKVRPVCPTHALSSKSIPPTCFRCGSSK